MKTYTKETVRYYDASAEAYAGSSAATVFNERIDAFVGALQPGPVLDLGCGPGHDSLALTGRGRQCVGLDASARMIGLARRVNPGRVVVADALALPFNDGAVAGIWCSSLFVHIQKSDLAAILWDIRRVLKPRGMLAVITARERVRVRPSDDYREYVMYTEDEIRSLLVCAGFAVALISTFDFGAPRLWCLAHVDRTP